MLEYSIPYVQSFVKDVGLPAPLADTDHSRQDQHPISVDDCTTQGVLSETGRRNSRAIGEAIRTLDVPIGPVLASPLCRTVETAVLAFGSAEKSMATREAGPEPVGSPGRYAALRGLLSTAPPRPRTRRSSVTGIRITT